MVNIAMNNLMICTACLNPTDPLPEEEEGGQWGWWKDHELCVEEPHCSDCDAALVNTMQVAD